MAVMSSLVVSILPFSKMIVLSLVLFAVLFQVGALELRNETEINVQYELTCPGEYFAYNVRLIEEDVYFDDRLAMKKGFAKYKVVGSISGNETMDGLWNNFFEINLHIRSNCTHARYDWERRVLIHKLRPVCPIGYHPCNYTAVLDLSNRDLFTIYTDEQKKKFDV